MSQKAYWIYGVHSVEGVLNNPNREIKRICCLKEMADKMKSLISLHSNVRLEIVDKYFFSNTFGKGTTHQGCAVMVYDPKQTSLEDILSEDNNTDPVVVLDQITDPHNIGAILRSAAVFGARCVIVQDAGTPEVTSTIAKTASGALEVVPLIRVTNISRTIKSLKEHLFWCVGLSEYGDKLLTEIDLKGKFAFVIGSEGSGMRRLTKESCDMLAKLPVSGNFSTLNAAQACTVTLYESYKQRCV